MENEDRVTSPYDEDEDVRLDTDKGGSQDAALTPGGLPFGKEFQGPPPDGGGVNSAVGRASHEDLERGSSQTAQEGAPQQGPAGSQSLEAAPTPPAWTVSRIAGWLSLGSPQKEGPAAKAPEVAEHLLLRHQTSASKADDGEPKASNDEGAAGPGESGWFQRRLPNFLNLESEESGLGLLRRENDPEVQGSSTGTGQADPHSSAGASDTGKEGRPHDSEAPYLNWLRLDLQDILTFGSSSESAISGGKAGQRGEPQPPSSQLKEAPADEYRARKPGLESMRQEARGPVSPEAPGTGAAAPDSAGQSAQPHTDLQGAAGPSLPTEPPGQWPQSQSAAQDSASGSQVTENGMEESGRETGQSGWYGSTCSCMI